MRVTVQVEGSGTGRYKGGERRKATLDSLMVKSINLFEDLPEVHGLPSTTQIHPPK